MRTHNQHQRSVSSEAASQKTYAQPDMAIDNLNETYCNDFECTSSPAVEQTVRQLARDITRFKYTTKFFQPDVEYNDGFRSFKGAEKYRGAFWAREKLQNPRAVSWVQQIATPRCLPFSSAVLIEPLTHALHSMHSAGVFQP